MRVNPGNESRNPDTFETRDFYLARFLRRNPPHLKFKPLAEAETLWREAERLVANDPELLACDNHP